MTQQGRPSKTAQHPFNKPSADFILRSSDLVDFCVHSPILSQASPFFESMLALPQPASTLSTPSAQDAQADPGARPIVPVSENSATLDLLLRLVYPICKPHAQMEDPRVMVPVLLAATKYEMALPIEIMSERLAAITPKSPLQVWAAACRAGLESVARQAAEVLRESWASWTSSDAEALPFMDELGDMGGISAGDYYRLKRFLREEDRTRVEEGVFTLLSPSPSDTRPPSTPAPAALFSTDLPSTDVICRSSSRAGLQRSFSAHQIVLSMRSPVLKARLAEHQERVPLTGTSTHPTIAATESSGATIVLEFDEGPQVVAALLRLCYDQDDLPSDLDVLAGLVVASQKYRTSCIIPRIRAAWDEAAALHPLEAYLVAHDSGLKECAEEAAVKVTLGEQDQHAYEPIMDSAPALAYHRLLVYADACCKVTQERMTQAMDNVPQSLYDQYVGHVSTDRVTIPLKTIATTRRRLQKEDMRRTLCRDICGSCDSPPTSPSGGLGYRGSERQYAQIWRLLRSILQCVVTTPDDIDEDLKKVKIDFGREMP